MTPAAASHTAIPAAAVADAHAHARCQHDAATRCTLCDLSTNAPARDADWMELAATAFRASKHDSAIFALALPAVLALAADPLLSMVDTIFVGQVGAEGAVAPSWVLHALHM